jgi:uncharacterized membrane protein YhhN
MTALPLIVCAAGVAVLLLAEYRRWPRIMAMAKLSASSAFVWLALQQGALNSDSGRLLLLGLLLCWCGDLLLLWRGQSRQFRFGIAAFLLVHVAYALAFLLAGVAPMALLLDLAAMSLAAALVLRWLMPHVPPGFRIAVPAYVAAIFAMVATAISARFAGAPAALASGAILFAVSDLAVARERFVSPAFANRAVGLPLYYGAQLLIAGAAGALG